MINFSVFWLQLSIGLGAITILFLATGGALITAYPIIASSNAIGFLAGGLALGGGSVLYKKMDLKVQNQQAEALSEDLINDINIYASDDKIETIAMRLKEIL